MASDLGAIDGVLIGSVGVTGVTLRQGVGRLQRQTTPTKEVSAGFQIACPVARAYHSPVNYRRVTDMTFDGKLEY